MITDDGEFLIVLNVHATDSALRIYRRRDHMGDPVREGPDHGVFIRDITLREIWPADKLADVQIVTDETPQWFAGGTFEFSTDLRLLIHKTRWGNTVRSTHQFTGWIRLTELRTRNQKLDRIGNSFKDGVFRNLLGILRLRCRSLREQHSAQDDTAIGEGPLLRGFTPPAVPA